MRKRETHIVKGMSRDMSVHRFDPNLVIDARNIRITTIKDSSSLLSVTNEKGTREFTVNGTTPIKGTIIGTAVLNDLLILFTTDSDSDRIYRLKFNSEFTSATNTLLFPESININRSLGFQVSHPLETLPIYENEDIQKVYWVDGINQPRMINVAVEFPYSNPDIFNFNREINGQHIFKVVKSNTGGEFPAGTVQYCFNYYNKFGQETNIVDVSPMYYLSPRNSGLPADAISTNSFTINIQNIDSNYDYLRLYAIVRTSENAVPNVRIVGDYRVGGTLYLDTIQEVDSQTNPVIVDFDNLYIIDGITGERKDKLSDLYSAPEEGSNIEIHYGANDYILDEATDNIYCFYVDNVQLGRFFKATYITIVNSGGNIEIRSRSNSTTLFVTRFVTNSIDSVTIVDNGIVGSTIDAAALLFIGGQNIIAETLTTKDSTLFLGNIKQNIPNIGTLTTIPTKLLKDDILERALGTPCIFTHEGEEFQDSTSLTDGSDWCAKSGFFNDPVDNNRSSYEIKSFKAREEYRLGFIAQYNTGQWSEAVWLGDYEETFAPGRNVFAVASNNSKRWVPNYRKPGFTATIPSVIVGALLDAKFIRIAPVVVYPNDADRNVLYQGILNSTVYNVYDRGDNSPFAQADWRFRLGYNWKNIVGEVQCNPFGYANTLPNAGGYTSHEFEDDFATEFYRDPSILTFHCPDIEARDDIYQSDFDGLKMRIVGISNKGFTNISNVAEQPENVIDTYLDTKTQGFNALRSTILGFSSGSRPTGRRSGSATQNITRYTEGSTDLSYGGFLDNSIDEDSDGKIVDVGSGTLYKWTTYLWHRNGSLNNQPALSAKAQAAGSIRYALLGKKIISEIKYARTTFFQNYKSFGPFEIPVEITTPKLVNDSQLGMEKIDVGNTSGLLYYGNIDKVITPNFRDLSSVAITSEFGKTHGYNLSKGYPIYLMASLAQDATVIPSTTGGRPGRIGPEITNAPRQSGGENDTQVTGSSDTTSHGKDPISMKYKTTKHLVIGLKSDDDTIINHLGTAPNSFKPFWKDTACTFVNVLEGILDDTLEGFSGIYNNSVFVAELYREFTEEQKNAKFGGHSQEAIANNIWKRCGESVPLVRGESAKLYYREGDTYVGRYDCLKSYPFTDEDQNQIVSIYSTELESRVNLDARYDKNKGLSSNLYMRPTNFNLFNHPGYEQSNQYFTYKAIDYDRYTFDKYPNMLTWSVEKRMGADIDSWTSIPMTSTADVQGDLGEITKLETFNDTLFSFQRRGIAQVLFNSRVQIPTSDGQPIEITNGFKFGGLRYITNQIGLTNKWSFCTTPNGMYFVDDEKNTLYIFNGQQLQDLSSKYGFRTWFSAIDSHDIWNPSDYNNLRTFYDKVNGDLYFMTDEESLVFSEQLGTFTSFMDYMRLPAMVNVNDRFLTFTENSETGMVRTWEMFAGDFNDFFGTLKPYWITFISNTDPTVDKVYDNLAWRTFEYSDVTDDFQGNLQPLKTFNSLRVWNDHQDTGEVALYDQNGNMNSVLKKKFNVFRTYIPRDRYGSWKGKGLNRIRNTWSYIKLSKFNPGTDLLMFSDLDVDFFE